MCRHTTEEILLPACGRTLNESGIHYTVLLYRKFINVKHMIRRLFVFVLLFYDKTTCGIIVMLFFLLLFVFICSTIFPLALIKMSLVCVGQTDPTSNMANPACMTVCCAGGIQQQQ